MTHSCQKLINLIQTGDRLPSDCPDWSETSYQRLITALNPPNPKNAPGAGDIASLVRHILRREDELQGGSPQTLKVPRFSPWPTHKEIWQKHGFDILVENSLNYVIRAHPWQPEWLDLSRRYPPDAPGFKAEERRNCEPQPGDPFLSLLGRTNYRNIGQKEAIRAVLTAPKNATLVVNLPTGSGKSLVAQLPALLASQTGGVSIVVVPTTALALDQERALSQWIDHPTAYYGDNSLEGKTRRKAMRDRICNGSQRILFTSPESLISSLAPALYKAAQLGRLRYLILDEAHMVEQWGDEFRPAFQEIPGLRRDLLRIASFQTLLLTATLTESCLETLETLFGEPGEFKVISAVQLRPEPAYWFAWCPDEETRTQRLIEAIAHLPRPLIIYTTKVEDVKRWDTELSEAGFKRYRTMTGKSSTQERCELIEQWRNQQVDLVIATSAFGLGVDQSDVRAVIHVCIPETIDRFYQEVGRGGRDGKAAISLTLHTTPDVKIAQSLNEKSYITIERGLERWQSMFSQKEPIGNDRYRIPINIPPTLREKDIDMNSEQNRAWNIRTLTLMSRSGLIEIDGEQPPKFNSLISEAELQQIWEKYRNSRVIRIRNQCHLDRQTWESKVEPVRKKGLDWAYQNLKLMKEALRPKYCLSEIFAQTYSIHPRLSSQSRTKVTVSKACGGCPHCRKVSQKPFPGIMPYPKLIWTKPQWEIGLELSRILEREKLLILFYDALDRQGWKQDGDRILKWLIEQGIRNLVIPPQSRTYFWNHLQPSQLSTGFIFYFEKYEPIKMPHIPTLIFHRGNDTIPETYLFLNHSALAPRILMLPEHTPDPSREDRKLIEIFSGRYFRLNHFLLEIGL
ncbi:DEAD/DEAH box helicase [Spirulina subsalsa FACHB-351]|uniref:DNA 3'-5' helicase n=1 Tax=Spirulina subsalsa FACHB-351 TaxID=234711 RepID=A0ABT3L3E2_9CYAN|nr:protein DpdF [Spirulina subsalsa]MCW6036021.1 DEAD/DEAH box helicase [Spirulina subsalsa FACHB-351]